MAVLEAQRKKDKSFLVVRAHAPSSSVRFTSNFKDLKMEKRYKEETHRLAAVQC